MTGIGRVCGVSASSAPSVTTSVAAELVARGEQLGAELPPAHVGLDAADQDDVAVEVRAGEATAIWVLGPGDPPVPVVVGRRRSGRLTWKS